MALTRRRLLQQGAAVAGGMALAPLYAGRGARAEAPGGPYAPTWDSLSGYQAPEWFRDAKFGIWAHWGPQCVPEQGDWYARQMYQQGNHDYDYQCAHYGHPSKAGFKDVARLWGAEKWDPERLIGLYKRAGAKYFMCLANHHDNFDCFNSQHQPWNAVALGPKRDIVGGWEREVRRAGLRFAVSVHGSRAWSWYEVAQGSDATGPLAGVPYDGHLTRADGKGLWWDGLDPQELYAQSHTPGKGLVWSWDASKGSSVPDAAYCEKFYRRTVDLIDQYDPDLVYFDDTVLPFYPINDVGLRIAAHYYNSNQARRGGHLEAVITGKGLTEEQRRCILLDIERGRSDRVEPLPWQTDTCIGNWHYQRSLYENHQYKTVSQVVHMLVDIVSKNGNLMLNIPVRGDGTIDPDEEAFLAGFTAWMDVNAEAIHATRPWGISGEGVVRQRAGSFNEGGDQRFTPADIRFTTRGNTLYATALAWPDDGVVTVRTLAKASPNIAGDVRHVELLGHRGSLPFERTADGLVIRLPRDKPADYAYALKITGLDLAKSVPAPPPPLIATVPTAAGPGVTLRAVTADLHGDGIKVHDGAETNIGFWNNAQDYVTWPVRFDGPSVVDVSLRVAAASGASALTVSLGSGPQVTITVPNTGDWNAFQNVRSDTGAGLAVAAGGADTITVRPADAAAWRPVNLASVTLSVAAARPAVSPA